MSLPSEIGGPSRAAMAISPRREWIARIFSAKAARKGGIVRRKVSSVEAYASLTELQDEVERRGFHMVRSGDQYVIRCNAGEFKVIC